MFLHSEACAIWNSKGEHTQIIGPKRQQLFFATIRFLTRHKAESHQYLVIKHRDGNVEHVRGPIAMFENPALHDLISINDSIFLESSSDFIVVHGQEPRSIKLVDSEASTCIPNISFVQGPANFIPSPDDRIHNFCWSTIVGKEVKVDSSKFQLLRSFPTPLDIVVNVMLSNRHSVTINLHVDYKISSSSPNFLLQQKDPIAQLHNAIIIDGQSIGNSVAVESVREWQQSHLSDIFSNLESYSTLKKTANDCGLEIWSICLTGQSLSHDLKHSLTSESVLTEELRSEMNEIKQRKELKLLEQVEKIEAVEAEIQLKRMKIEADDQLDKDMHGVKLAALKRRAEVEVFEEKTAIERTKMKDEMVLHLLEKVKAMDVDMTQLLSSSKGAEYLNIHKRALHS